MTQCGRLALYEELIMEMRILRCRQEKRPISGSWLMVIRSNELGSWAVCLWFFLFPWHDVSLRRSTEGKAWIRGWTLWTGKRLSWSKVRKGKGGYFHYTVTFLRRLSGANCT